MREAVVRPLLVAWSSYQMRFRSGEFRADIFRILIVNDARRIRHPLTALDICCACGFYGSSRIQRRVAATAIRYIGVDPYQHIVVQACVQEVHHCFVKDAPIRPTLWDVAFALMLVEHIAGVQRLHNRVWEALKPAGVARTFALDAPHYCCAVSQVMHYVRGKNVYLRAMRAIVGRDSNYPSHYRCITLRQVRAAA